MVSLLLSPEPDLGKSHVVKTIYDPACGTGGMLSVTEDHLLEHNREARPILYGQDINDEAWAVCKSDMLLKGQDAENIIRRRHVHQRRLSATPQRAALDVRLHARQSALRRGMETAAAAHQAGARHPRLQTVASERACPASTTGRCCSCCTCSPRCSPPTATEGAAA